MTEPQRPPGVPGEEPVQISWVGSTSPTGAGQPSPDRRRTWILLAGVAVAVIILVIVLAVRLSGENTTVTNLPVTASSTEPSAPASSPPNPPPSTASADPAAEQANTVDQLLSESATARRGVQPAINNIDQCRSTSADRRALRRAEDRRRALIETLNETDLSALPDGGRTLGANLRRAWTTSADADAQYLAWEREVRSCTGAAAHESHYDRAYVLSGQADKAKKSFVREWNAIASQYGLTIRQSLDI